MATFPRRRHGFLRTLLLAPVLAGLLGLPAVGRAADYSWDGDTSSAWSLGANWIGGIAPANSLSTDTVTFNLVGPYDNSSIFNPNAGTTSIAGITIGSSNGTMNLSGTNLSIGASGITIASGAGAFTDSSTTTTLGANQSWTNNSANTFTVSGAVAGGANILTLAGTGNGLTTLTGGLSFSGAGGLVISKSGTLGTTISGGTITLGGTGGITINSGASAVTLGAATLGAAQTWTNNSANLFTVNGNITNSTVLLTIGGSGDTTVSSVIGSGSGGLTKTGTGTLTLTNANTYTGATTINGGTLAISNAGSITSASTISTSGTLTLDNVGTNNTNRYRDTDVLTFSGGTLKYLGNSSAASTESINTAMTLTAGYASTVDIQAGTGQNATVTFASLARNLNSAVNVKYTGAGAALVFGTTAPTLTNGIVPGMFVNGADFATHGGSAPATIAALPLGSYTEMLTFGTDTNNSKVTSSKTLTNTLTTNSLKIDGAGTININQATFSLTITTGMILKTGAGSASISGGSLLTGTSPRDYIVRVDAGDLTITSPLTFNVQGSMFAKSGPGLLILTPSLVWASFATTNKFLRVQEGAIRLDAGSANFSTSPRQLAGGVFELTADWLPTIGVNPAAGGQVSWATAADGGFAAYGATRTVTLQDATPAPTTLTWGTTSHVQNGKALLFNSDTADSKIVMANNIDLAGAAGQFREFRVAGNTNAAAYAEITGNIIGTSNQSHLLKTGAGRLDLSGNSNTYQGETIVQGGTLNINGTLASGSGLVTVMTGATLGGTGTINRPVLIQSGGTLSPGTSPGTLTVGSGLTLSSGSFLKFEIGDNPVLPYMPTAYTTTLGQSDLGSGRQDKIVITGAFNGSAGFQFNLLDTSSGQLLLNSTDSYSFTVATGTTAASLGTITYGTPTGAFLAYQNAGGTIALLIDPSSPNNVYLSLTAPVPEPHHVLLICVGAMLLGLAIRRRMRAVAAAI